MAPSKQKTSLKETISKFVSGVKDLAFFTGNFGKSSDKLPVFPEWFFTARIGQPRNLNVTEIRDFSKSAWVQMVLSTIKKEVTNTKWDLVKKDSEDETDYTNEIEEAKNFLLDLNTNHNSINDIHSMIITDLGEIDAGTIVNVFSADSYEEKSVEVRDELGREKGKELRIVLKDFGDRELVQVFPADSGTFLKQIDIYRRLQAYYQYSFKNPKTNPIMFYPDEVVYSMMNKRSYSLYGFSPVQSIVQVLELLIQSTRYNKDFFKDNAIPAGMLTLPGANPESLEKMKKSWVNQTKGKPHRLLFNNLKDAVFQNFNMTQRDMEWLDGQKWYHHLVFGAFGVSPTEAGFHENVNQGNQAGQERITVKNAIKPYYKELERITNIILKERFQDKELGFVFKYVPKDQVEEQVEFDQAMQELDKGALTINEYRRSKGKEPVEWGDEPYNKTPSLFGGDNPFDNKPEDDSKDNDMEDKSFKLEKSFNDDVKNIMNDSSDYYDFYKKVYKKWEKEALKAVDNLDVGKMHKEFGDFIRILFSGINSFPFLVAVKHFVKQGMVSGLDSAEKELDVQIGFTDKMNEKLKSLTYQQVEGYITPIGKQWSGIKGATKVLQLKILKQVETDLKNGATKTVIKDHIKDLFKGSVDSQAERIARTETSRFFNENKLLSSKESELELEKYLIITYDARTSEVSKLMGESYGSKEKSIPLDEEFVVEYNGKQYRGQNPPFMPNDRDTVVFVQV